MKISSETSSQLAQSDVFVENGAPIIYGGYPEQSVDRLFIAHGRIDVFKPTIDASNGKSVIELYCQIHATTNTRIRPGMSGGGVFRSNIGAAGEIQNTFVGVISNAGADGVNFIPAEFIYKAYTDIYDGKTVPVPPPHNWQLSSLPSECLTATKK